MQIHASSVTLLSGPKAVFFFPRNICLIITTNLTRVGLTSALVGRTARKEGFGFGEIVFFSSNNSRKQQPFNSCHILTVRVILKVSVPMMRFVIF